MRLSIQKREALKKLPYPTYLKSDFWKSVRELALKRAGYACQTCNAKTNLQVHHRTYQHRGYEDQHIEDLVTLCNTCHKKIHNIKVKRRKKRPKRTVGTTRIKARQNKAYISRSILIFHSFP
ncbi:HNH endonuclease (plasmid) [Nostoc sp. C052]|uniref:HNH endonuclease n=1 Tax=Nostoc sp. C052 TaxID=2576902 RepID=UPI0015C3E02C|nr:HNH endonuclease [Nostoc sp. C052]QLE46474.1 HNH endonuclease [Nostoc sp. C052]